jgi:hypothetical protein
MDLQILKRKFTWHSWNYRMGPRTVELHNAKATFYWKEYWSIPFYFRKINTEKASDRNHTFNHLNGWKTTAEDYSTNISLALLRLKVIQLKSIIQNLNSFDLPTEKLNPYKQKIEESRVRNYYVGCSKCWFWSNNHKESVWKMWFQI